LYNIVKQQTPQRAKEEKMKIIFVGHQKAARIRDFENLWEAAEYDGLSEETFENFNRMIEFFGDSVADIPVEWVKAAKAAGFPAVHISNEGETTDFWLSKKEFDEKKEQIANDFLLSDWQSVIPVASKKEAKFYATKYTGHQEFEVRKLAREILENF